MGQKTNPISNRIGITRGWDSNWVGGNYAEKIAEDYKIRKYLSNRLAKADLSKIVIERTLKLITVTIHAARPGVIIGKGGTEVEMLKKELKKVTKKDVQINIFEVRRPEVDANIVANSIARQIEGRVSYRRAIKMAIATTMRVGAEGIKVQIAGRVGGAKWPAARCSRKDVPLSILSVPTSTTLSQWRAPRSEPSESRYGSATESATASRTSVLTPAPLPTCRLPRADAPAGETVVTVATAAQTVATAVDVAPATILPSPGNHPVRICFDRCREGTGFFVPLRWRYLNYSLSLRSLLPLNQITLTYNHHGRIKKRFS